MGLILCIESSTTACSVCVSNDGIAGQPLEVNDGYSHAEKLAPFVDEVLKTEQLSLSDLDAIAVSKGPGSYTGLRIGVSLAKGLCFGTNKPLLAIDTLQQMCLHQNVKVELDYLKDPLLIPMLDARRMEVYAAVYDVGLKNLKPAAPVILDEHSFSDVLKEDAVLFFGNGSDKFKDVCVSDNAYFVRDVWPSSTQMAMLAEIAWQNEELQNLAYFEPNYVKAFQATTPKKLK